MKSERKPATRLPDDDAYWDRLARRSITGAFGTARKTAEPWWQALSDASFALAASAALALIGGPMLLGERATATTASAENRVLASALAPEDPMLHSLLASPAGPPAAATLLQLIALREGGQ